MGRVSDASSIQTAFVVPLLCYLFILYFGLSGYKPAAAPAMGNVSANKEDALA